MSSTANAVERRLERTGETLERAAGFTANAFYKASAKMMEGADRTFTRMASRDIRGSGDGLSPNGSPKARKTSPQLQWIPYSDKPVAITPATDARWQAGQVTPAVASNARVSSATTATPIKTIQHSKSDLDELQAAQQEEQALQWALAQSLMDMQVNLCQSLNNPDQSDGRTSREGEGGRKAQDPAVASVYARWREADNREIRAQKALAEAQQRISVGRSEMRQLRGQIADSRNSIASLNERLYDADCDLERVTVRINEIHRLFVAAKHSVEACLVSETSDAPLITAARREDAVATENLPDE
jgi:hypothetical protein